MTTPPDGSRAATGRDEPQNGTALPDAADTRPPTVHPGELPVEPATAFAVEGFEPDDPWNAALCVETETAASLLPLTPKTVGALLGALAEVDRAQRTALGVPAAEPGAAVGPAREEAVPDGAGRLDALVHRARVVSGSAQLARLWSGSLRGRLVVIGGAALFLALGVLLSVLP